jgi:tRNA threonylcarbamoyladenosine biosynthesis protein TsaB
MKVLALDTSTKTFSVALLEDDQTLVELQPTAEMSASRELIPAIQRLLGKLQWRVTDLELIALPIGPGSFSGLRIGAVVAKTLAYARSIPVIGVNTLEVIASQCAHHATSLGLVNISALMDAQRRELFVQSFRVELSGELRPISEVEIVPFATYAASVGTNCLMTGEGLTALIGAIPDQQILVAPKSLWRCNAPAAGVLGLKKYKSEPHGDFWSLLPIYHRPSAAEEKRIERSRLR